MSHSPHLIRGRVLIERPAILEWVEARWLTPALLPSDREVAADVRAMAALIGCDIHPISNLRMLRALKHDLDASQAQIAAWVARWIAEGFAALETLIARHIGACAFGDQPTIADGYLVPQNLSCTALCHRAVALSRAGRGGRAGGRAACLCRRPSGPAA